MGADSSIIVQSGMARAGWLALVVTGLAWGEPTLNQTTLKRVCDEAFGSSPTSATSGGSGSGQRNFTEASALKRICASEDPTSALKSVCTSPSSQQESQRNRAPTGAALP